MTTARERAREAARIAYYGHSNFKTTFLDRHADAASDVWESGPRALWEAMQTAKAGTNQFGSYWNTAELVAALREFEAWAQEAFTE